MTTEDMAAAVADAATTRAAALRSCGLRISLVDARNAATQRLRELVDGEPEDRANAAVDLAALMWPPHTWPPPEWWATPLGRAIAAAHPDPAAVAHRDGAGGVVLHREAAAMLGISRSTVTTYVRRGDLAEDPATGQLLVGAVLDRIATKGTR